jgi:alginate O-acetyltransferase complex protein AlgI
MVIATYFFAFQLYCDFAGYTNMAIGAAKFFGFDLIQNFNKPYFATSVTDYWKRNHISLTTWLRDYVFYPLMGTHFSKVKIAGCTIIMFLLSGLWHGANWTFVIWGLLQGIFLVYDQWTTGLNKKLNKFTKKHNMWSLRQRLKVLVTFNCISFSLIFFRAGSLSDAFTIVKNIFTVKWEVPFIGDFFTTTYGLFGIIVVLLFELFQKDLSIVAYINKHRILWRWSFYYLCLISIILLGALNGVSFIYFQF